MGPKPKPNKMGPKPKPNKVEWIRGAIGGLSLLKGKQRDWMRGMSRDDLEVWAASEYARHFED